MSNTLTHKFASAAGRQQCGRVVQPSHWNAEHLFSGGADGDVLAALGSSSDGAEWVSRQRLAIAYNVKDYGAVGDGAPTTRIADSGGV